MGKSQGIGLAIAALVVGVLAAQRPLVRMPTMSRLSDDGLLVGSASGDHARYVIGPDEDFNAVTLGYDMSYFGGGMLSELGSRAVLHYMTDATYARVREIEKCGQCAAGYLTQCEASSQLGHMLLIPANEQALAAMKKLKLKNGQRFRLEGNTLSLKSAQINGQPLGVNLGSTQCFLVETIEPGRL